MDEKGDPIAGYGCRSGRESGRNGKDRSREDPGQDEIEKYNPGEHRHESPHNQLLKNMMY
jgi:hypothetical protein